MTDVDLALGVHGRSGSMPEQRVAVVVGGASGIGAACARRLAADGLDVVVADVAAADGVVTLDVTNEAQVGAVLDDVVARRGRLDVVVNSAGTSTLGAVADLDLAEWQRVIDVNLTGSFLVLKHAARRLADGGVVVTISSLNARQAGEGFAPYCASKAGLVMLSEVAALELAPRGIRVNTVSPGLVDTPLTAPAMDIPGVREDYLANTPLGRAGSPDDVAAAVAWICSPEASWLTGENLDLNGGAHLRRYPDVLGHVGRMFA